MGDGSNLLLKETIGNQIGFRSKMGIMTPLPHALEENISLFAELSQKKAALFLDFDGTLSPLVDHPSQVVLSEAIRDTLRTLAKKITVTILSGRSRDEVEALIKIPELFYGGVHGLDIKGPGLIKIYDGVLPMLPVLKEAREFFQKEMEKFPGAWIEEKKYGLAFHYRPMGPALIPRLKKQIESYAKAHPQLKMTSGKQLFELRPNVEWDKGSATLFLLKALHLDGPTVLPIFLGDDETDEDVFRVLKNRGWGILVDARPGKTSARAYLRTTDEVELFLKRLLQSV